MRRLIERIEERGEILWDIFGGKDPGVDKMLTSLGFNPAKPPKGPRKKKCPECGKVEMITVERHADTDMNCMAQKCKSCGYEKEL